MTKYLEMKTTAKLATTTAIGWRCDAIFPFTTAVGVGVSGHTTTNRSIKVIEMRRSCFMS